MQPVVVVLVVVASVAIAELVASLVTRAVGDDTATLAGRLLAVHRMLDLLGGVLVPSMLALVLAPMGVALGWGTGVPSRLGRLSRPRQLLAALAAPITHLAIAAAVAPFAGTAVDICTVAVQVNLVCAAFLLLPAPPLPGGALVGLLLRGAAADRWAGWQRWSRAPFGLVAAGALAWWGTSVGVDGVPLLLSPGR